VLSARIKTLIENGIVEKVEAEARGGFEYRLTQAGNELAPILESVGTWGQRWTRSRMSKDELDVELLMLSVQRNLDVAALAQAHVVLAFVFSDLHGSQRRWWLLVDPEATELCTEAPGRPEDVTLTCSLRTMTEVFTGDTTLKQALASGRLQTKGPTQLLRSIHRWLRTSALAAVPRAVPA
jgi:putative sterol carrier protein